MSFYGCSDSLIVAIKTPRHRLLFRPACLILFRLAVCLELIVDILADLVAGSWTD